MSNNPIESIVTPYKSTKDIGVVIKVLENNRYTVRTDSGKKINVSAGVKWVLRSNVLVQNGRIIGTASRTVQPSLVKV